MHTQLRDIIIPEVFTPYLIERTAEKSAILSSGLAQRLPQFDQFANGPGQTIQMPHFQDLSGPDEIISDQSSATVSKITTIKDIAVRHFRIKAWGASDLVEALSGADPMRVIADLTAAYWARRQQEVLVSTLKGIFSETLASTHVHDIALERGTSARVENMVSAEAFIDAAAKLGDVASELSVILMHSVVYAHLQKQNLINVIRDADNNILFEEYLGKRIIVDNSVPRVPGSGGGYKYSTYLFAPGAVALGIGTTKEAVETTRDSLASVDLLLTRQSFIIHPRGVKWKGNPVENFPTNSELEDGVSWEKVYENKNIRIVELITNG